MIATIIISILLAIIVIWIVGNLIRKKKNGQGSCGCGCSNCAMSEMCHKEHDGR